MGSGSQAGPFRTIPAGKLCNDTGSDYQVSAEDVAKASWHKSSWSSYNGSCVEVAELQGNVVCMRDTKANGMGPVLAFTYPEWNSFLSSIRAGELDLDY
jgi:hypothetical protein